MLPCRALALTLCSWSTPSVPHSLRRSTRALGRGLAGRAASTFRVKNSWVRAMSASKADSPRLETPLEIYGFLKGGWDLAKDIHYAQGGSAGTWTGIALFSPPEEVEEVDSAVSAETASAPATAPAPGKNILRYEEAGMFTLAGRETSFEAGQRLVYDCSEHPVSVHFVDDPTKPDVLRFFHHLDFRNYEEEEGEGNGEIDAWRAGGGTREQNPMAMFEHLCVRDMYHGEVEVLGPHEFKARWRISGPHKDGRIDATFRRRITG